MQILRKFLSPDEGTSFGSLFDDEQLTGAVTKQDYSSGATNPDFYAPKIDDEKAVNKVYKSRIRFVPFWKDSVQSKIMKFLYFINNGEEKFYVDCPSNFGKKSNILSEAYFATWKNDTASIRVTSENFKRKSFYWALVQIVEDKQHPELEGQIKIFRFGNQIDKLIVKQAEEVAGRSKVNVFNPFTGKELFLDIREKTFEGQKQISYDESYFGEDRLSIMIDGTRVPATKDSEPTVVAYLKEKSPDLLQCLPVQWDEETEAKVVSAVRNLMGVDSLFRTVYKKVYGVDYVAPTAKEGAAAPAPAASTQTAKPAVDTAKEQAGMKDKISNKAEVKQEVEVPFLNTDVDSASEKVDDVEEELDFKLEDLPEE